MPANEIDDIFSSKGKRKADAEVAKPAEVVAVESKPKKDKKKKKRKADALDEPASPGTSSSKAVAKPTKAVAVTVFKESSGGVEDGRPSKRAKTSSKSTEAAGKAALRKPVKEDEERFRDSRGTGPRKKTEEGWNVFKEDELGINAESGDTPLCPFDCDCCF